MLPGQDPQCPSHSFMFIEQFACGRYSSRLCRYRDGQAQVVPCHMVLSILQKHDWFTESVRMQIHCWEFQSLVCCNTGLHRGMDQNLSFRSGASERLDKSLSSPSDYFQEANFATCASLLGAMQHSTSPCREWGSANCQHGGHGGKVLSDGKVAAQL